MISNSKQDWTVGATVKVGFLSLLVVAALPTPGDFAPDAYLLASKTGFYKFIPHNGLTKVEAIAARELVADAKLHAERIAANAMAKAAALNNHIAAINDLIFGVVA